MNYVHCKNITKKYRVKKYQNSFKGFLESIINPVYEDVLSVGDLSFDITQAECLGILGTNGSGKSTLIKMLTGILSNLQGELSVLGYTPSKRSRAFLKDIGVIFGHKSSLWWDLPLIESFESHKVIYGVAQDKFDVRLAEACEIFNLGSILDRPVKYLSLGERVKAEITANLLHAPSILFLDEPTVGLDLLSKFELRKFIKRWVKENGTVVVLTTHDMVDVEKCCDRVILLDQGIKRYDGNYRELMQNLIRYQVLDLKPLERPFTADECEELIAQIKQISKDVKVLESHSQHIVLEVDKQLQLKSIFVNLHTTVEFNTHLRFPTLEEGLRDYYLENLIEER